MLLLTALSTTLHAVEQPNTVPGIGSVWEYRMYYKFLDMESGIKTVVVNDLQWGRPVFSTHLGGRAVTIAEEEDHVLVREDACAQHHPLKPPSIPPLMCGWNPCTINPGETITRKLIIVSEMNNCAPIEGLMHYTGILEQKITALGKAMRAIKTRAEIHTPFRTIHWTPYIVHGKGEVFAETMGTEARYVRITIHEIPFERIRGSGSTNAVNTSTQSAPTHQPNTPVHIPPEVNLWIALGDSLTAGVCAEKDEAYPSVLERLMGRSHIMIANMGIPGQTSGDAFRVAEEMMRLHPKLVLLAIGANDVLMGIPPEKLEHNLIRLTTLLQNGGSTKVVLLGMNIETIVHSPYRDVYRNVALRTGAQLLTNVLHGIWENPKLRCTDGIHLTAEGYRQMAKNVFSFLQQQGLDH